MTRKKSSQGHRGPEREQVLLSARLDKNLLAYTVSASIAGVGLLALAQPAEARIIATPANISIPTGAGVIQFDINHDGTPDFGLSDFRSDAIRFPPEGGYGDWLTVLPVQAGNAIWDVFSTARLECAAAAPGGARIGGARPFQSSPLLMVERIGSITRGNTSICAWAGNHPPYLGLKFMIAGEVHYGWARVSTGIENTVVTGFAYETIPNKAIIAGATKSRDDDDEETQASPVTFTMPPLQSANLGMLAMGASRLVALHRREGE